MSLDFEYETLICKKCGKKYEMRPQPEDRKSISPILWKQYEQRLCDECFMEWHKANGENEK